MKKCIPEWERRRGLGWFWKMERSGVVGEKDVAMALTLSLVLLFFFFVDNNNNNNSNVYVYVRSFVPQPHRVTMFFRTYYQIGA